MTDTIIFANEPSEMGELIFKTEKGFFSLSRHESDFYLDLIEKPSNHLRHSSFHSISEVRQALKGFNIHTDDIERICHLFTND